MQILIRWFINLIGFLFWLLPLRLRWWTGCLLAWFWFDVLRLRRYTVLKNLTIAFPQWSAEEKYQMARKSMRLLCYTFPEFFTLPMIDKKFVDKKVIFEGLEHYQEALKKNRGVLLLSLHLGSGDMGITVMALRGLKVNLISKKFSNKTLNEVWFDIRERKGAKFIDAHGKKNAFEILAALKRNESVVFVIDQYMGKPFGIETTFFGRKTGTAYGLALFAAKTEAPVLPVYTYRDENLTTHLVIGPEIPFVKSEDDDLQMLTMTQKYNDKVEELVRRHPENWMWVHRRWKRWR
jgi:Kdo2-lipid IVA lauroyltransferase/acyltransferase